MRRSLLETFDEIYILNLHGNSLKRETAPDGGPDENVFDIRQGVAIGIFVRRPGAGEKRVYYADLWGKREKKYAWLREHDVADTEFERLSPAPPFYFFVPRRTEGLEHYRSWPRVDQIFPVHSVGVVTARDRLAIAETKEEMRSRLFQLRDLEPELFKKAYGLSDAAYRKVKGDIERNGINPARIVPILYRPSTFAGPTTRPEAFWSGPERRLCATCWRGPTWGWPPANGSRATDRGSTPWPRATS